MGKEGTIDATGKITLKIIRNPLLVDLRKEVGRKEIFFKVGEA